MFESPPCQCQGRCQFTRLNPNMVVSLFRGQPATLLPRLKSQLLPEINNLCWKYFDSMMFSYLFLVTPLLKHHLNQIRAFVLVLGPWSWIMTNCKSTDCPVYADIRKQFGQRQRPGELLHHGAGQEGGAGQPERDIVNCTLVTGDVTDVANSTVWNKPAWRFLYPASRTSMEYIFHRNCWIT